MRRTTRSLSSCRSSVVTVALAALAISCAAPAPESASSSIPVEPQQAETVETPSDDDVSQAAADEVSQAAVSPDTTTTTIPAEPTAYELALERFSGQRERTTVDRPDEHEGPMMKFLYVVPSFATDRERDINGEIASYVFHMNEWIASQNGGFGVRVDTFEGALDVPFTTIETTPEEWNSWFGESLAPAAERLISQGWPIGRGVETNGDDLYYVVWEAFAGNYLKTGQSGGGCRGVIDGQNAQYRMVGFAVANPGDSPCRMDYGRFPFGGDTREQRWFLETNGQPDISFIDHSLQFMRFLPDCGNPQSPFDGELYTVPSTDIVEIRGGFIRDLLENHDPVGARMGTASSDARPELDVRHNTYFHITTGRLARTSCNSDAGRHPMWSDVPFYAESPTVPRRSVLDRPDDVEGRQLHAVYVKAVGAPDRALDTGLEIAAALRDFDAWMRAETGGIGVRLDTFEGHLDVTYLPLPMTAEEFVAAGDCAGEKCPSDIDFERILIEAGYHDPEKTYAFLYDGGISPPGLCGGARNDSRSLLINLDDFTNGNCPSPWRAESLDIFGLGHLIGHELMHTLGAVCQAAAKADDGYHSTDSVDLMFGRADGPGQRLDPDRDTYWGPGAPAGCDVSTDGIFTTEPNLEPLDGTTLDSVPIGFTDLQPSNRTWWLLPQDQQAAAVLGSPVSYPTSTDVTTPCGATDGTVAATFTGAFNSGVSAGDPVALIWVDASNGRCLAAQNSLSDRGAYYLELPQEFHVNAAFQDGGGYCVVVDANQDEVFDSAGEPLECFEFIPASESAGNASAPDASARPAGYPSDTSVSTVCNESGGSTAVTFTGRLSGGEVADQQVAVIWVTETNGRCIAASTTSSDSGDFTLELPGEAHRTAAWEDGGGYCVVWDANGDGVFDSAGEPLECISNLAVGQTINWTLRS